MSFYHVAMNGWVQFFVLTQPRAAILILKERLLSLSSKNPFGYFSINSI